MLDHEKIAKQVNSNSHISKFNFKPAKQPVTGFSIQKELFLQLPAETDRSKSISQRIKSEKSTTKSKKLKQTAAQNYDLNMDYYSKLNHNQYLDNVEFLVSKYNMIEIYDLDEVKDIPGYYLLCLDEFSQFYFGSGNLRTEITKRWYTPMDFRVCCKKNSSLEIGNFGIFDTKRIFVHKQSERENIELSFLSE